MRRRIAILGSTGSIGTQALEVIREHPNKFEVEVLTAQANYKLLIEQAREFKPNAVVIGNDKHYSLVAEALEADMIKVYAGEQAISQIVEMDSIDMILVALVGFSGLKPTLNAIEAKKQLAIANKETFVVAGDMVTKKAREKAVNLYPVDSEHSAIFQCLAGESESTVEKIYLTASGGPFRGMNEEELRHVTKDQALKHPNWDMGCKITIDSASMMNKGFEVIEAKWLFNLRPEQIEVIIHPQSIIHSIVQFNDGSMKAQMSLPDMKMPIQYALAYPHRIKSRFQRFNFIDYPELTFEKPDSKNFRNLALAYKALEKGGNLPCVLNAANEIMVKAFLRGKVGFLQMSDIIEQCMAEIDFIRGPSLDDYMETDRVTRIRAEELIK
ncbi:MAG: 1-deoxy-D-xylulose-5-phosphate reductoisomerase [Bacteroidales bacterium]|nr:1-deoxy-D-xylulose-5-phosphate reductoisomerase [Bacteroidales bacterium]